MVGGLGARARSCGARGEADKRVLGIGAGRPVRDVATFGDALVFVRPDTEFKIRWWDSV